VEEVKCARSASRRKESTSLAEIAMKFYVGSRDLKPDGYLSVDIDPANKPDIVADIKDMHTVANDACEEIYASHVLEHLEWPDSFKALAEFARVLRRDGLLRVSVPDVRLLLEMLVSGESDFHEQHRYGFTERMLRSLLTILGLGDFDWWSSTLSEGAAGWCPANGGAKVAISVNVSARKMAAPMADPSAVYEALNRRPLDDPMAVVADILARNPTPACEALDVPVYQRIHFQLGEAQRRIRYLENEVEKMGADRP
jgi:hypothetical protein